MNYGEMIKKSWHYIKVHRFLWWLGIFAAITEGGMSSFSSGGSGYNYGGSNDSTTPLKDSGQSMLTKAKEMPKVLGEETSRYDMLHNIGNWFVSNWYIILIILIVLFIIYLIFLYISFSSSAGLILSINNLEEKNNPLGFKQAFHLGRRYVWRFLGLFLLIALIAFVILALFGIPVAFVLISTNFSVAGGIMAIMFILTGILALFLASVYLSIVMQYAKRSIVQNDMSVMESFSNGRKLFASNAKESILLILINFGLGIAYAIILMFALFVVGIVLFLIGLLVYLIAKWVGVAIFACIVIIALFLVLIYIGGGFVAFISSFWTLSYRELTLNGEIKELKN